MDVVVVVVVIIIVVIFVVIIVVIIIKAAASMSKGVGRVARVGVTPGMTAMNDDDDNISCK